jgi:hypothetical protein
MTAMITHPGRRSNGCSGSAVLSNGRRFYQAFAFNISLLDGAGRGEAGGEVYQREMDAPMSLGKSFFTTDYTDITDESEDNKPNSKRSV